MDVSKRPRQDFLDRESQRKNMKPMLSKVSKFTGRIIIGEILAYPKLVKV